MPPSLAVSRAASDLAICRFDSKFIGTGRKKFAQADSAAAAMVNELLITATLGIAALGWRIACMPLQLGLFFLGVPRSSRPNRGWFLIERLSPSASTLFTCAAWPFRNQPSPRRTSWPSASQCHPSVAIHASCQRAWIRLPRQCWLHFENLAFRRKGSKEPGAPRPNRGQIPS